ncbi:MAG: MOSC domain-containing protein [Synergistaceae bacterium]|nr:MOSC domain-containing protein [Synergistaceae bacterium]
METEFSANGRIIAVCTSKAKGTVKRDAGSGVLVEGFGLEGDAHGGFAHRQVSLIASEDIETMKAKLPGLVPGSFAENLTTEGVDLSSVAVGDRIAVGSCILEVSQIGKECHSECEISRRAGECIMPRKGIFCGVIKGGPIAAGDAVSIGRMTGKG